jgi:cytochrome oxidase Cu insertion factor (SCO1/SenC/PrrC family)
MVSVDPERDMDGIAGYVDSFVPGAHAVASNDLSAVRRLALSFGADFVSNPGGDPEHTDALYAVDDAGQLLVTWPYATDYDDIAGDIEQLLGRYDDA